MASLGPSAGHAIMDPVVTPTSRVLVGRDAELSELCSLLGVRAPDQRRTTSAVLLGGDAGVGKTRLLTELRDVAFTEGWQVVAGHCLDFGDSALPYLPFTEILGRLATDRPEVVAEVSAAHPALARLQPGRRVLSGERGDDLPGEPGGGALDRTELFEALHALLSAVARSGPLLVVVEDAHWADQSTRDVLSFLFSRPVDAPGGLVVSYRADDLHRRHPLRRQVAEWARLRDVGRVHLEPLDATAVRDLVAELAAGLGLDLDEAQLRTVTADVVARAEGNAFFVEELVAAASSGSTAELPVDLADLLLVRLDRLDETARHVVRAASAAGRRVGHDMLRATAGLDDASLDAGLRGAVDLNVLVADRGAYAFRHALLAEAVYDDLLPGERVRLHAAYAAALSAGSAPGTAAELARHARAAMDLDTALEASVRAGREAALVGGPDEAAQHLQQALELLADPRREAAADGPDVSKLAVEAGDALNAAGHPARAAALVGEQLDRLGPDAPVTVRARLLSARASYLYVVDTEEDILALSQQAVDLLPEEAGGLRARVLAAHARILAGCERYDEARAAGLEALALAERLDLQALASEAMTTVAGLKNAPVDRIRAALADAVAQAEAVGALNAELRGRFLLARSFQDAGEWDEAVTWLRSAVDRARAGRVPWAPYGFEARWQWSWIEMVRGDWETAGRLTDTTGEVPPPLSAAMLGSIAVAMAHARGEDVGRALRELRRSWALEGAVAIGSAGVEILASADPMAVHDDAVAVLSRLWHPLFSARVRLAATTIGALADRADGLAAGRREEVLAVVERLLADGRRVLEHQDDWGPEGRAWAVRLDAEGLRARWLLGADVDQEALVASWWSVVTAYDGLGHVLETARCRVVLAMVLRAVGDTAGSREAADLARATAQRLGLAPMLDQLRTLGSTPVRTPSNGSEPAADLTPRETEILALVAQGRSNGEIGKQLFISTKTVSVHVSNILAKLGAAGRTEAAAIAHRRGLLP